MRDSVQKQIPKSLTNRFVHAYIIYPAILLTTLKSDIFLQGQSKVHNGKCHVEADKKMSNKSVQQKEEILTLARI